MKNIHILILIASISLAWSSCKDDPACDNCDDDLISGTYNPTSYTLEFPDFLPVAIIPEDNPMTEEGIELGRMLFYDPILSVDSSMSCASCHLIEKAFTDGLAKSVGVQGLETRRSSMAIENLVFMQNDFFWDGRSPSLEDQALKPVEAHDELNDTWENVVNKFKRHPDYPQRFRAAFGIERKSEITKELAAKAIAQFERTLISANSKYDAVVWRNEGEFTEEEEEGFELFKVETAITIGHPGCTHCHNAPLMTDNSFRNNGLDDVAALEDFVDKGRGEVTNTVFDNGKFRVPSLRNIALTAPYMHDGRFETLEEVLDHYASGGHGVENEDTNIIQFDLTPEEKQALIAFLHTLTDTSFINNPAYKNPF